MKVVVIGAGPAGLTAAYKLSGNHIPVCVLEKDPRYVGGISRTENYRGYRFDIGGHRFFSKSPEIEELWKEILPGDLLTRSRLSSIYYNNKFFSYPLKPLEAFVKLGFWQSLLCVLSYLKFRLFPVKDAQNFEDWVTNQFGKRLFNIFFKTYTEKVWGMSCREISADWAAQRIKGLSLGAAVYNALIQKGSKKGEVIKTLIDTFRYPRLGPGMMWETCARKVKAQGGNILMGAYVKSLEYEKNSGQWEVRYRTGGEMKSVTADHIISSAPLREVLLNIKPSLPEKIREAAEGLKYRDFITVMLMLKDRGKIRENWIYIHDPGVKVGRIQNFKAWSPEMVPDPEMCSYGLEYFCFENDGMWNKDDKELIGLAVKELMKIGLAKKEDIKDGCVVRQKKAYPVYDEGYRERVEKVRSYLEKHFPTLHQVGRNGMHKYNNQDHAMMTALLSVENIIKGFNKYDIWRVNQDAQYLEKKKGGDPLEEFGERGERSVPVKNTN